MAACYRVTTATVLRTDLLHAGVARACEEKRLLDAMLLAVPH